MRCVEDSILRRSLNLLLLITALICLTLNLYAAEEEYKAIIQLKFSEEDSQKYITAQLNDFNNDSIGAPLEEIDLFFYVERTFSLLPIGDVFNTTDENGEVRVEFPSDLPGDSVGNVKVIVKLEDADEYSDTETGEIVRWGVPTPIDVGIEKRSLWSAGANAPISLLLLTNSLIAVAWGIIFYIMFRLYKLSKI
jgi:hypothetical protein